MLLTVSALTASLFMIIMLPSCEKVFMKEDARVDPETIFEEVWSFTNDHYSFFELKGIDWDEAYSRFRPLVRPDINPVELFDICAAMLYELRDGHVNLVSPFDRSRYWEWYLESPENFNYPIIERSYYQQNQRLIGPLEFINLNDIIYIYYPSFASAISKNDLDIVMTNLEGKKGLILDVRNNGGGSIVNAKRIISRLTDEKRLLGHNFVKTGPGHNDFRKEDIYVEPYNGRRFTGDVVVLTNRRSYSATTYFTQYMKALPNVTVIGDVTGGGGGIPAFYDLANGWLLRVSSSRFYSPSGADIESGVSPHIKVDMTKASMDEEKDDILEKAIEILSEGK